MTHLEHLELRLMNERSRLYNAKTPEEREMRLVWVNQCEREIDAEYQFLGIVRDVGEIENMSLEEILSELEEISTVRVDITPVI